MVVFGLDVWVFCFVCGVVAVSSYIIGGMMVETARERKTNAN